MIQFGHTQAWKTPDTIRTHCCLQLPQGLLEAETADEVDAYS